VASIPGKTSLFDRISPQHDTARSCNTTAPDFWSLMFEVDAIKSKFVFQIQPVRKNTDQKVSDYLTKQNGLLLFT
jgi:hypothetical protein